MRGDVADQAAPEDVLQVFFDALERGCVPPPEQTLCRDVTFVTQDATAIRGRERVASLLAQLIGVRLQVLPGSSHMMELGEFALASAGWEIRLSNSTGSMVQRTEANLVFALRESRWKLLLIAPWGWPVS
jgi:hypothetical protein